MILIKKKNNYEPNIFFNYLWYDKKKASVRSCKSQRKKTRQPIRHEKTLWYLMTADAIDSIQEDPNPSSPFEDPLPCTIKLLKLYYGADWEQEVLQKAPSLEQWPSVAYPQLLIPSLGLMLLKRKLRHNIFRRADYRSVLGLEQTLNHTYRGECQ